MTSHEAIAILVAHRDGLRALGVNHAALFRSIARNETRPESDLDIMIDLDPAAKIGIFQYAGIRRYIAELFSGPVDVVERESLKAQVRPSAENDAIYAF